MNSKKLSQWMIILIITTLTLAGCGGQAPIQPTETSTPIPPTNTPIPPTNTPIPPTPTPLPTEVIVLVSPEAMDVISSWNSSINAFTLANNPVTNLEGLTANDVGFWNNSQLGISLYKEVVKLLSADLGSPWEGGLYGKPDVNTAFPSVRIYFTDDSVTDIDGAARVIFQDLTPIVALPTNSISSKTETSEKLFDLIGVWKSDNVHAPDNSWNISYSMYFQFTNTKQYVYHGVDTFNSNRPTDVSDIVYLKKTIQPL